MFDSELTIVFLYKIPPFEGKIKKNNSMPSFENSNILLIYKEKRRKKQ